MGLSSEFFDHLLSLLSLLSQSDRSVAIPSGIRSFFLRPIFFNSRWAQSDHSDFALTKTCDKAWRRSKQQKWPSRSFKGIDSGAVR